MGRTGPDMQDIKINRLHQRIAKEKVDLLAQGQVLICNGFRAFTHIPISATVCCAFLKMAPPYSCQL